MLFVALVIVVFALVSDASLADRAGVFALEPRRDALLVEPVQALQDDVLLFDLVLALADGTLLVFFTKVLLVRLSELVCGEGVQQL